jgi:hypothetical protein
MARAQRIPDKNLFLLPRIFLHTQTATRLSSWCVDGQLPACDIDCVTLFNFTLQRPISAAGDGVLSSYTPDDHFFRNLEFRIDAAVEARSESGGSVEEGTDIY